MKILSSIKYQLNDSCRALLVFWGIVFLILILAAVAGGGNGSVTGMEMASAIFIFVVGLNSFKPAFNFSMANGISRKTQFIGFAASISIFATAMAIADSIFMLIFSNFMPYSSLFTQLYFRNSPQSFSGSLLSGPVWSILLYIMVAMMGYMICLIYYRSGLAMKLAVSIAPPVILFIVLPFSARLNPEPALQFINFIGNALGLYPHAAPMNAATTFLIFSVLFAGASFFLMRRAEIKR